VGFRVGKRRGHASGGGYLLTRYRSYIWCEGALKLESRAQRLIATNLHLFGRTACLLFTQFFLLRTVSGLGEVSLAAHAVLWQVWSLVSYGVDGFAHGVETLVGNALGTGDHTGAIATARRCMKWGGALGAGCGLMFLVGLPQIGALLTDHVEVVARVAQMATLLSLTQPFNGLVYILDGILMGANDVAYLFLAMAIVAFGIFLPAVLGTMWMSLGLWGAWVAYSALMLGRFALLYGRFRGRKWVRSIGLPHGTGLDTTAGGF
jgi:Na+-driven multidrug efflux pump